MNTQSTRRSTRLYRDPVDKKIGGVASGVARYFDIDTTLMRAIWAASILVGGFGLFLYLILWFILDEDPELLATLEPAAPVDTVATVDEVEPVAEAGTAAEDAETADDEAVVAAVEEAEDEIEEETLEADL